MLRILITGARDWTDYNSMFTLLNHQKEFQPIIIEGECCGADLLAKSIAIQLNYKVEAFPADWEHLGRSAGPARNIKMINRLRELQLQGYKVAVFSFHCDISQSKGTKHCVNSALKFRDIPVYHCDSRNITQLHFFI